MAVLLACVHHNFPLNKQVASSSQHLPSRLSDSLGRKTSCFLGVFEVRLRLQSLSPAKAANEAEQENSSENLAAIKKALGQGCVCFFFFFFGAVGEGRVFFFGGLKRPRKI